MDESVGQQLAHKIPFFFGLKPRDMQRLLEICAVSTHPTGEVICKYGTKSQHLYILLEGTLEVVGRDGTAVAEVTPITTVGEMGFFNRKPRSATVRSKNAARLLSLEFNRFEALLDGNIELRTRLYRNVIRVLADRLSDASDMIARYKKVFARTAGFVANGADESSLSSPAAHAGDVETTEPDDDAALEERAAGADEDLPAAGCEGGGGIESGNQQPSLDRANDLIWTFYALTEQVPAEDNLSDDRAVFAELDAEGYSEEDIEYAIKWTARNIPSARRFNMVKLSIREAFENKWSV